MKLVASNGMLQGAAVWLVHYQAASCSPQIEIYQKLHCKLPSHKQLPDNLATYCATLVHQWNIKVSYTIM